MSTFPHRERHAPDSRRVVRVDAAPIANFLKRLPMKRTQHSKTSAKAKVISRTAIASTMALLFASSAFAAPGAPSLKAYEINGYGKSYGFVHVDQEKAGSNAPYKDYVTVNKTVEVPLPFDIWSNGTATKAVAVIDGVVDAASQVTLTPGSTQTGTVIAHPTKPGKLNFQVRAYAADGSYTDSSALQVMVFDTRPEFADDLPNNVPAKFKKYTNKSGSVVGSYFTTWSIYDRQFDMSQVPVEQLTHILYGFIPICGGDGINDSLKEQGNPYNQLQISCKGLPNYSVAIHDSWGEVAKVLPGQTSASPLKGVMGQMMAAKKRNPNLKILPSIGGWTLSDPFFQLDNVANRKVFVDSVEQFLRTWKFFDGVDIDWEFPGGNGANPKLGKPTDGATYVTLMKELRAMLDKLSAEYGKPYELTSAIGAGKDKIDRINYKEATKYMNYIFDMTYDYYGAWDMNVLGHQTALNAPKWRPDQSYTSANSMQALLDQGVDPGKLVMGVAAYGRGWTGIHGMTDANNPFTGKATGPQAGQWEKGILDYKKIVKDMAGANGTGINGYQYNYDETAEAPYLFNPSNGDLITYDNARSTLAKGQYVQQKKLGGMFSWEIDADTGDLLNAMHEGVGNGEGGGPANLPPVANAGADIVVQGTKTITLDASQSKDPEGEALTFKWEQVSGGSLLLNNSSSAQASVVVPEVFAATDYRFRVTVTDPHGLSSSASVLVTAKPVDVQPQPDPTPAPENHAPVARLSGPDTVDANTQVTLDASGSTDPDGDALTFTWKVPSGITATKNGAKLTFTAPSNTKEKSYTFTVTASDGKLSATATKTVTVKAEAVTPQPDPTPTPTPTPENHAPVARISGPATLTTGNPGSFDGSGSSDEDGDTLTYTWNAPAALQPTQAGSKLLIVAPVVSKDTPYTVSLKVSDGKLTHEVSHTVTIKPLSGGDTGGDTGGDSGGNTYPAYKAGTPYKAGDVVSNGGKLYECKPWPYSGWCGQAAFAYEPGKGFAWSDAWTVKK